MFNANVFIHLVEIVPEKPTLSMTELLNSSSKHPHRGHDSGLKRFPKITSTPEKNCVRSPSPASSDSFPDPSHRSSSSRSFVFSYSILRKPKGAIWSKIFLIWCKNFLAW